MAGLDPRLSGLFVIFRAGPVDDRAVGTGVAGADRRNALPGGAHRGAVRAERIQHREREGARRSGRVAWALGAVARRAGNEIFLATFVSLRALCVELCDPSERSNGRTAAAPGLLAIAARSRWSAIDWPSVSSRGGSRCCPDLSSNARNRGEPVPCTEDGKIRPDRSGLDPTMTIKRQMSHGQ